MSVEQFPEAARLPGPRLDLEPLHLTHAQEMAPLLNDPRLHEFTGGEPASEADLQERYRRQLVGRSPDGRERWLNWVIRSRSDGRAVGTVQATVEQSGRVLTAEVAWVIVTDHQGQGYAGEAARVLVAWLEQQGVETVIAHVHPDHHASQAVARAVGLGPTGTVVDGEIRWQSLLTDAVSRQSAAALLAGLAGAVVTDVDDGEYILTVTTGNGAVITVEGSFSVVDTGTGDARTPQVLGAAIVLAATEHGGDLAVTFDRARLDVPANERHEAWNIHFPGRQFIVCMPGGELAVWS